jgi:hypothetical protein
MTHNPRLSKQLSEDDLFSQRDETDDNYECINKKKLVHLENDESITIYSDLGDNTHMNLRELEHNDNNEEDDHIEFNYLTQKRNMRMDRSRSREGKPKTPKNKQLGNNNGNVNNKNKPMVRGGEELLKFMTDTSDIFGEHQASSLNNVSSYNKNFMANNNYLQINKSPNDYSTCQFDVYLPGGAYYGKDKERIFTLQSQSSGNSFRASSNYKEKFEFLEGKHKELSISYNNLTDQLKTLQEFYLNIFQILHEKYNKI